MAKPNEIRYPDDSFLLEVEVGEDGEVEVGKTVNGTFKGMKLSTVNARALKIASMMSTAAVDKRSPAKKNRI